ncbi:MAG: hypothetical protein IPN86_07915 [Saprospiraceae bacterium]|nr:hypothetical protein [Saprospiraceae bacterium]
MIIPQVLTKVVKEDDHDPAGPKVFDLALFMVNDTDILEDYGDNVRQTITVTNQVIYQVMDLM